MSWERKVKKFQDEARANGLRIPYTEKELRGGVLANLPWGTIAKILVVAVLVGAAGWGIWRGARSSNPGLEAAAVEKLYNETPAPTWNDPLYNRQRDN